MDAWSEWLNASHHLHPIDLAAEAHHRLAAIHPLRRWQWPHSAPGHEPAAHASGYPPAVILRSNRQRVLPRSCQRRCGTARAAGQLHWARCRTQPDALPGSLRTTNHAPARSRTMDSLARSRASSPYAQEYLPACWRGWEESKPSNGAKPGTPPAAPSREYAGSNPEAPVEPVTLFAEFSFRYPFRKYQRVVAGTGGGRPEGPQVSHRRPARSAGKSSSSGWKLIRRFGEPAVVFAPTATIQAQWYEKLGLFLPKPEDVTRYASMDPRQRAPIRIFTYQLISHPRRSAGTHPAGRGTAPVAGRTPPTTGRPPAAKPLAGAAGTPEAEQPRNRRRDPLRFGNRVKHRLPRESGRGYCSPSCNPNRPPNR